MNVGKGLKSSEIVNFWRGTRSPLLLGNKETALLNSRMIPQNFA